MSNEMNNQVLTLIKYPRPISLTFHTFYIDTIILAGRRACGYISSDPYCWRVVRFSCGLYHHHQTCKYSLAGHTIHQCSYAIRTVTYFTTP